jgi:hypothetical protein
MADSASVYATFWRTIENTDKRTSFPIKEKPPYERKCVVREILPRPAGLAVPVYSHRRQSRSEVIG